MRQPVYLDHAATTPVRPEVRAAMAPYLDERFGNPSSAHRRGREARTALDEARERLAAALGARPDEVVLTSGGTEGDALAVLGAWRAIARSGSARRGVVTTTVEHRAVLAAVEEAAATGADARLVGVDGAGRVDPDALAAALGPDAAVCSVQFVNNETGVTQELAPLAERARAAGAIVHTDAVQALGRVPVDCARLPVDLLTISGHKLGAPKGVGALYVRRGTALAPLVGAGSQERGRRPGTENVAFAVALATAAELVIAERASAGARLAGLRARLEEAILAALPDAVIHGRAAARAPHVTSVSIPGTDTESLLMALDLHDVAASGGSACQSGSARPSHVLAAMGVPAPLAAGTLRLSLGATTTEACVARVAGLLPAIVAQVRAAAPAGVA